MDKNTRIAELLKKKGIKSKGNNDISQRQSDGHCALSFSQQRLWYLDQLSPEQSVYNLPSAFRLKGHLAVETLFDAINLVVKRHDSLRTSFRIVNNQPVQIVTTEIELQLSITEFEIFDGSDREQQLREHLVKLASIPFDLQRDLLFRVELLKLSEGEYVLFLMTHHTISDGTSMTVLINEIAKTYSNLKNNPTYISPPLEIQYTDYSEWQHEFLSGEELERHLDYWRNIFKTISPVLNLSTDFPRPTTQSYGGATLHFELPAELTKNINQLARSCDTTSYTVLLSALNLLLSRYSGQDEIVIGTLISNRPKKQLNPLIGFFANTLAIRTCLPQNGSVKGLVAQVRNAVLDAHQHQSLPFEKLVAELDIERDFSRTPLFQVLMGFQQVSDRTVITDEISFAPQLIPVESSKTDIAFFFSQDVQQISLELTYSTALFEQQSMTRMYANLMIVLESMTECSELAIKDVPVVSEFDQQTCLSPASEESQSDKLNMLDLFYASVKEFADKTAVKSLDKKITYSQLDELSNQLARYLIKQGVRKGEIIGLCTGRGIYTLVSILSIFKTGCAYLPLDPEFPNDRLEFMVKDSGIRRIVGESQYLFDVSNIETTCIDKEINEIKELSNEWLKIGINENDIAYVIYTSGSTGKPKGVEIQHFALANFLRQMTFRPGLDSDDIVLSITTFSFDISILEMLLPLAVGACCVVADEKAAYDGNALIDLLEQDKITLMQATPSMWRLLLISGWQGNSNLKALCGGEALSMELVEQLKPKVGSLWNMYGPTETTIWSTCHEIEEAEQSVSIGRAIGNTQLYCLDPLLRQTPVGVPGELYIGGKGLAKGYLHRPELTSQRFMETLMIDGTPRRVYRTGDEVRFCNDGRLQYLGRLDSQVKLRGYRIELGEIENVLAAHPLINQSAARVFKASEDDLRLVAYFVSGKEHAVPTNTELRQYLAKTLPDYMIPQFFVSLEQLPRTANGKTDRLALPDPQSGASLNNEELVAPETAMEKVVADHWREALGEQQPISVKHNFFVIGGHSMLAVMVLSKIQQQTGVKISPMLIATGTLKQVAKEVENKLPSPEKNTLNKKTKRNGLLSRMSHFLKGKQSN